MNVEPVIQPKAAPHCFWGGALRGGNGPVWMGSVDRQFHRRSQRGKGQSRLPAGNTHSSLRRQDMLQGTYDFELLRIVKLWL